MTKEQELLLYVLKRSFKKEDGGDVKFDFSDINWKTFVSESLFQAVSYIAFENSDFLREYIPDDVYKKWSSKVVKAAISNINVTNAQNALISKLDGKYDYLILKGLSVASYYPDPELRCLGDVDFLIDKAHASVIKKMLIDGGYTCSGEDNDHHIVFCKPTAHLEMHFEIPGIPNGKKGDRIRQVMSGAFRDRVKKTVGKKVKSEFFAPDTLRQGLILILHTQHHMLGEGIGLRHLMDWACFVDSTKDEPFWQELLDILKEIGLFVYASAVTKTCAIYLGIDCPKWCENVSDDICEEIILDILSLGNFGHKNMENSISGLLISDHGKNGVKGFKFSRLCKQFDCSVRSRHGSLKRCILLYPFFAVYEVFRYLSESAKGKKPKIRKIMKYARTRKSIYKKLHVFETKGQKN